MYILTQGAPLENNGGKIYEVHSPAHEKEYTASGYQRSERIYKIEYRHSDYYVYCLEFRNDKMGIETVVLIPDFVVPGRRYPLDVYLYAIDRYSSEPEKGQREIAEETRKRFGLETFAHTTLGRALKTFVKITGQAAADPTRAKADSGDEDAPRQTPVASAGNTKASGFPTVQSTWPMRERAARFLHGIASQTCWREAAAACRKMAREWFFEYRRLLL